MIDPKDLRDHPEKVETSLKNRGCPSDMFPTLQQLDKEWRTTQQALEQLQETKNKTVPKGKPTDAQRETLTQLSQDIKTAQDAVTQTKQALDTFADTVPNILQDDVPIGTDETENIVVRTEGSLPKLDFDPKSHDTLATDLNIIDFDQATTITGSRFAIFKGLGAKLERAIATFMLDTHTKQNEYQEISPPLIASEETDGLDAAIYKKALETSRRLTRDMGIDKAMFDHDLCALVMPTSCAPWSIDLINGDNRLGGSSCQAAVSGYPSITVPMGYLSGLPVGISIVGKPWNDFFLAGLAFAFEQNFGVRVDPGKASPFLVE